MNTPIYYYLLLDTIILTVTRMSNKAKVYLMMYSKNKSNYIKNI